MDSGRTLPTCPIEDLVGVKITANGQTLPWNRDDVDIYEFHIDIPQGVSSIDVDAEFISPPETGGFSSGGSITSQLAVLRWNPFLLYPKGTPSDQPNYQATLKVPSGWRYGTALPIPSESGNQIVFKPSSLTTLVNSPVQTGANFHTVDLVPNRRSAQLHDRPARRPEDRLG
jgi:predicted metalloprotease with PDZ domain